MAISDLLATTQVSLSTTPAAVTAPADMPRKCTEVTLACWDEGEEKFVKWERQPASDSSYSKMVPAYETSLPFNANPGQTLFYAKVSSGTARLDVEWWG